MPGPSHYVVCIMRVRVGRAGAGHARVDWNVDAVYFTEADQVVYMDDVRTILVRLTR